VIAYHAYVEHLDTHDTGLVVGVQGQTVNTTWIGVEGPDPDQPYDGSVLVRWHQAQYPPVWENEADLRVLEERPW